MLRIRITYKKFGDLIYTGHLDLQKIWERSFRRANLPLAYSSGFHPQARIQQAAPLPLGFLGNNEIVDIWINCEKMISNIEQNLIGSLPNGIQIIKSEIVDLKSPSLQSKVIAAQYRISFIDFINENEIQTKVKKIIRSKKIPCEKKGKTYNLRELIEDLKIQSMALPHQLVLLMRLKHLPGATGRPEEVLKVLEVDFSAVQIERENLYFEPI